MINRLNLSSFWWRLSLLIVMSPLTAMGLVDYAGDEGGEQEGGIRARLKEKMEASSPINAKQSSQKAIKKLAKIENGSQIKERAMNLSFNYESIAIKEKEVNGDVSILRMMGAIQTPINIFMNFSYYGAKSDDKVISSEDGFQKGNPKVAIGFNWLKIGNFEDLAQVDLYGGITVREKKSTLASSRNDKTAGLKTTKNFYNVVLGLIGEITFTGRPSNNQELAIGNITKIGGAMGWVVSSDIRIEAEFYRYAIRSSKSDDHEYNLKREVSFSVISPRLLLNLFPGLEFSLGGHFQTNKKEERSELINARLYDIEGVYGNSIYLGLGLSM